MNAEARSALRDPARLTAVHTLTQISSAAGAALERPLRLAARGLHAPIGLVSLIDADRQFLACSVGLPEPWRSKRHIPLSHSFCQHVVATGAPLAVNDAREHALLKDNLAIREFGFIAYVGVPLTLSNGQTVGCLAAIDSRPRTWDPLDTETLQDLARFVVSELELQLLRHDEPALISKYPVGRRRGDSDMAAAPAHTFEIFERITDGFVILNREWRYVYVNRRGAEFFGREPQDLIGKHIWQEFPEGVGQPFHRAYERAMIEQVPLQFEEYYSPWGRWFENRVYPSPEGISIFYQEITQRKNIETTLRTNEQRLRLALQAGAMGIFDWDLGTGAIVWSEEHARLFGMTLAEFDGRYESFVRRVHPADLPAIERALAVARREHGLYRHEFRIVWPDGSVHWIAAHGQFFYDDEGHVHRMTGVVTDIDARKRAELALSGDKKVLEMMAEGAALADVLDTITRNVETLSKDTLCSILLLDADGVHLRHGAAPSLPGEFVKAIDGAAIGPDVGSCGTAVFRNEAVIVADIASDPLWERYRDLALSFDLRACWSMPIRSSTDCVLGSFALYYREPRMPTREDFSLIERVTHLAGIAIARKQADAALHRLTLELEERVRTRTAELVDMNVELEAFSYTVSHDLRAPLRAVQGLAQALYEDYGDKLDARGLEYAQRLVSAAERMDGLIQDLLGYSRLTRAALRPEHIDLSTVLDDAREQLAADILRSGARLTVKHPLPPVLAHRATLTQAVSNLLGNAIKFVAPGAQPKIAVWAEIRGDTVRLWIEDNGIGIDPEHHERVFRAFERLHGSETYPGTGIGLAIVRKGMERMGGHAGVESSADHGSRFWIELPLSKKTHD